MAHLSIENLTLSYDTKNVVKNLSLELEQGEVVVVLGASGDGKTSLLKAIAGYMPVKKGVISFQDEELLHAGEMLVPGHEDIRLVNQDFSLDTYHTVEENIRLKILRFDKAYQEQRITDLLRLMKLTRFRSFKTTQLSGGQQQRLAIARALADEPSLILLDEPFNQLDFQTKDRISRHLKRYLKKHKISVVMVTHNGIEAMEWADRIVYIEKGRIKRIASPTDFFNHPHSKKEAAFFGMINQLKIGDKKVYFRPSFFSREKTDFCTMELQVEFVRSEFLGWYSLHVFKALNQKIQLFSTHDISSVQKIFIHPIEFND